MPSSSPTVMVRRRLCCHLPSPMLLSAITVVVVCRRCRPLPLSSAFAAVIATLCLCHLLPPALVRPLCSPPLNLACRCCLLLSIYAFTIVVRRRHLPPPQPSSPLRCLRRLSPPALILPHLSPLPNHACCCHPPLPSSATVVVHRHRTSTCPPSYKMLIVAL